MGDAAGECPEGLHFLRLAELAFQLLPLRDVAGRGENADHRAGIVPVDGGIVKDRGDAAVSMANFEGIIANKTFPSKTFR